MTAPLELAARERAANPCWFAILTGEAELLIPRLMINWGCDANARHALVDCMLLEELNPTPPLVRGSTGFDSHARGHHVTVWELQRTYLHLLYQNWPQFWTHTQDLTLRSLAVFCGSMQEVHRVVCEHVPHMGATTKVLA